MWRSIVTPELLVFTMNVAAVSLLVGLAALVMTAVVRRSLTLQHGLLCTALGLVVASPVFLWLLQDTAHGLFRISFISPHSKTAIQEPPLPDPPFADSSSAVRSQVTDAATARRTQYQEPRLYRERVHVVPSPSSVTDTLAERISVNRAGIALLKTISYWIVMVWCVVSAVLAIRFGHALYRVNRVWRHLRDTTDPRLIAAAQHVEDVVGLSDRLRVCESPGITVPVSMGFWRPVVVMPEGLADVLETAQLVSVMLHEAAHIVRRDPAVAILQKLSQAMFWWNPAIHLVNRNISRLRELICDDFAVSRSGDGTALGEAILRTAEWSIRSPSSCALTPMLLDQEDELEHRVVRLFQERRILASAMGRNEYATLWIYGALLVAGIAVPLFRAQWVSAAVAVSSVETRGDSTGDQASTSTVPVKADVPGVKNGMDKAVLFLKQQQQPDGSWKEFAAQPGGVTSLCTLALLKSGVPAKDTSVQRALAYLRKSQEPEMVYATALRTMVFCAAEPEKDRLRIQKQAQWLREAQVTENPVTSRRRSLGSWAYGKRNGLGDNSNMRFAAMALSEAERVGVRVDREVWARLRTYLLDSQNDNGSWGYKPGAEGTGSMTCGAVASLAMAAKNCDEAEMRAKCAEAIVAGTKWLEDNFTVQTNPISRSWHIYYLDALARAGTETKQDTIGEHNWYREGAELLIKRQDTVMGIWKGTNAVEGNPLIATSFALLFLSNRPDSLLDLD